MTDRNGNNTHISRAANGEVGSVVDQQNRTFTFAYTNGRLSSVSAPPADGRSVSYGYNIAGLLTSVTNPGGDVTRFTYANNKIATVVDGRGTTTVTNTYVNGRVNQQQDADSKTTDYDWVDDPATGGGTSTMTDPNGKSYTDRYTGNNLAERNAPGGSTTKHTYTARGNVATTTDGNNKTRKFGYDANDNQTSTMDDEGLATQTSTSRTYDNKNNVKTSTDELGNQTTYDYDGDPANPTGPKDRNLIRKTAPNGSVVAYGRDPAGSGLLVSMTDENGMATQFGYGGPAENLNGQLTSITSPLGAKTTTTYDSAGRPVTSVDARGNVAGADPADYRSTTTYDANGRVKSRTSPGGATTAATYDGNGNREKVTDARGNITTYTYDAFNRLTKVTAPDGTGFAVTAYAYDLVGNLKTRTAQNVVDGVARPEVTTYGYNANRQLISVTDSLGGVYRYGYDANGNIIRTEDANGTATATAGDGVTLTTYDSHNRVATIDYADTTRDPDVNFTYTKTGKRKTMTDAHGTTSYGYAASTDRLVSVGRDGQVFTYTYTPAGKIKTRTYPDGTVTTYTYTADGQLETAESGGKTTTYQYLKGGLLEKTILPASNGHTETRTYTPAGRLETITNRNTTSGAVLSSANYLYDGNGNPTRVQTEDETVFYAYNDRNMLNLACYNTPIADCDTDGATTSKYFKYTYDKVGNRLTQHRPINGTNDITRYTYNTNDQLTFKDGPTGTCALTYDDNGNLLTECGGQTQYSYNDANQMTRASPSPTASRSRTTPTTATASASPKVMAPPSPTSCSGTSTTSSRRSPGRAPAPAPSPAATSTAWTPSA